MRAKEFIFETPNTDQDAQIFFIGLLANAYSLEMSSLKMNSILKSMLGQGYNRDAKWVLNTIKNLPDDDNLIVDKDASDAEKVVLQTDKEPEPEGQAFMQPEEEVVGKMAQSALNKRIG